MMFGIIEETPDVAAVWAVGTDWITENPLKFQRATKKVLPMLTQGYTTVGCLVDAENVAHVRWLLANGFSCDQARLLNKNLFYLFYLNV